MRLIIFKIIMDRDGCRSGGPSEVYGTTRLRFDSTQLV